MVGVRGELVGQVQRSHRDLHDPSSAGGQPIEVRSFLEGVLESYPDLDIRVLAAARRGEPTEEGHEALTKAMRDLL